MINQTATPNLPAAQNVLHPLMVRITHWLNATEILVMIGSGWRVYNQEPLFGFTIPVWMTLGGQPEISQHWHNEEDLAGALPTAPSAITRSIQRSRRRNSTQPPTGWNSAGRSATSGRGASTNSISCRRARRSRGMFVSRGGAASANGAGVRCAFFSNGSRPISPPDMWVSSAPTGITPASTCRLRCIPKRSWPSPSRTRYCRASLATR